MLHVGNIAMVRAIKIRVNVDDTSKVLDMPAKIMAVKTMGYGDEKVIDTASGLAVNAKTPRLLYLFENDYYVGFGTIPSVALSTDANHPVELVSDHCRQKNTRNSPKDVYKNLGFEKEMEGIVY